MCALCHRSCAHTTATGQRGWGKHMLPPRHMKPTCADALSQGSVTDFQHSSFLLSVQNLRVKWLWCPDSIICVVNAFLWCHSGAILMSASYSSLLWLLKPLEMMTIVYGTGLKVRVTVIKVHACLFIPLGRICNISFEILVDLVLLNCTFYCQA